MELGPPIQAFAPSFRRISSADSPETWLFSQAANSVREMNVCFVRVVNRAKVRNRTRRVSERLHLSQRSHQTIVPFINYT